MKEYKQTLSCILLNLSAILSPQLHSFFPYMGPNPLHYRQLAKHINKPLQRVKWEYCLLNASFMFMPLWKNALKLLTASFLKHQQEDLKYLLRLLNNSSHIFSLYMSVVLWIVQMIEYSIIFMDIGYLNEVCFNILFFFFFFQIPTLKT